jgi:hypothetical protein
LVDNALSPILVERLRQAGHEAGYVREQQARVLLANLPVTEEPLRSGCVVVLEDARIRIRRLPVGGEN